MIDISSSIQTISNYPSQLSMENMDRAKGAEEFQALLLKKVYLYPLTSSQEGIFAPEKEEEFIDVATINSAYDQIMANAMAQELAQQNVLGLKEYFSERNINTE